MDKKSLNIKSFLSKSKHTFRFKVLLCSFILNLLILGYVTKMYLYPMQPDYYSTSVNGKTQALISLSEPNTSDTAITQWAALATVQAYSYDFVNYESQIQSLRKYFTDDAWDFFLQSLTTSNTVDQVVAKKLVVNAVVIDPPVILAKGYLNGVFSWRMQIPILVTYQAARGFYTQKLLISLLVSRISTLQSVNGIGISQFSSQTFFDAVSQAI